MNVHEVKIKNICQLLFRWFRCDMFSFWYRSTYLLLSSWSANNASQSMWTLLMSNDVWLSTRRLIHCDGNRFRNNDYFNQFPSIRAHSSLPVGSPKCELLLVILQIPQINQCLPTAVRENLKKKTKNLFVEEQFATEIFPHCDVFK